MDAENTFADRGIFLENSKFMVQIYVYIFYIVLEVRFLW